MVNSDSDYDLDDGKRKAKAKKKSKKKLPSHTASHVAKALLKAALADQKAAKTKPIVEQTEDELILWVTSIRDFIAECDSIAPLTSKRAWNGTDVANRASELLS